MKKVLTIGLLLCLLIVGCKDNHTKDNSPGQTEISAEDRAVHAAEDYWKVEDGVKDTSTGEMYHITVVKTPTEEDNTFILVLSKAVEDGWRTVEVVSMDADTHEITKMS